MERIRIDAIESCATIGLMVKSNCEKGNHLYNHAPLSLFPTPYPADLVHDLILKQMELTKIISGVIADPSNNINGILDSFS